MQYSALVNTIIILNISKSDTTRTIEREPSSRLHNHQRVFVGFTAVIIYMMNHVLGPRG